MCWYKNLGEMGGGGGAKIVKCCVLLYVANDCDIQNDIICDCFDVFMVKYTVKTMLYLMCIQI